MHCKATSALALLPEALEAHWEHNLGLPPAGHVPHSGMLWLQLGEAWTQLLWDLTSLCNTFLYALESCRLNLYAALSVHGNYCCLSLFLFFDKVENRGRWAKHTGAKRWQPEKSRFKLKCGYHHMSVRKHWWWSRILKIFSDFWNIIDKILLKNSCIRRFWALLACRLGRQNQIVCVGEGNVLFLLSNRLKLSHSFLAGLTLQCWELTQNCKPNVWRANYNTLGPTEFPTKYSFHAWACEFSTCLNAAIFSPAVGYRWVNIQPDIILIWPSRCSCIAPLAQHSCPVACGQFLPIGGSQPARQETSQLVTFLEEVGGGCFGSKYAGILCLIV